MQLAVVVAEKRHLRSGDLRGDLHLIKGRGLEREGGEDPHLHKVVAGSSTEVFKRLDALLAHPFPQLLGGPVVHWIPEHGLGSRIGDGLELQASRRVQLHGKQGLPAANRHRWRAAQALPEQQPDKRALHERTASRARAIEQPSVQPAAEARSMPQRWIAKGRGEQRVAGAFRTQPIQRGLARIHQRLQACQLAEIVDEGGQAVDALLLHQTQHGSPQRYRG